MNLRGTFTALFAKVEYLPAENDPKLGAAKLRLNFDRINVSDDVKTSVNSTSKNFRAVVNLGAAGFFALFGGNIPGAWLGHTDVSVKDVGDFSPIVQRAELKDVKVGTTTVGAEPAIELSFSATLPLQ